MQEKLSDKLLFVKKDFSLLLSLLLIAATFFLAFYIFTRKRPAVLANENLSDTAQAGQINSEPVISNKPLPPNNCFETIGDKLSEAEQKLKTKKNAAALHALGQARAATSLAIETQTKAEEKEKLRSVLSEVETIEREIHHGEVDGALKRIRQIEKQIEPQQ